MRFFMSREELGEEALDDAGKEHVNTFNPYDLAHGVHTQSTEGLRRAEGARIAQEDAQPTTAPIVKPKTITPSKEDTGKDMFGIGITDEAILDEFDLQQIETTIQDTKPTQEQAPKQLDKPATLEPTSLLSEEAPTIQAQTQRTPSPTTTLQQSTQEPAQQQSPSSERYLQGFEHVETLNTESSFRDVDIVSNAGKQYAFKHLNESMMDEATKTNADARKDWIAAQRVEAQRINDMHKEGSKYTPAFA